MILLGVITFLTVAFLFLSQRERGSVATTLDQSVARLATEAAVERAKTEMIAQILGTTNRFDYGLRVSTNFINPLGFLPAGAPNNPPFNTLTNVNYNYPNGNPVTGNDLQQNIANLYYSPRPPVFIQTNKNFPNALDFRFWLDLNRNGVFDTNGLLPELASDGSIVQGVDLNGIPTLLTNFFVGDPEWIGILDRTDRPHAANNKFVSRFAFAVVPSGKTLDLNTIHNMARRNGVNGEGFWRNMSAGTWELNLASFLVDLNTNTWNPGSGVYTYQPFGAFSTGTAFEDARDIVRYRYGNDLNTLRSVRQLFGGRGATAFQNDLTDGYTDGLLMLGRTLPLPDNDNPDQPWPGAENLNYFLTTQDLFDDNKLPLGFINRLRNAGTGTSSYDRYTFYRLLSQLGTGTGPEPAKMHLNYSNIVNGIVVPNAQTNFVAWEPVEFFTNAVDRLLKANLDDPTYNARLFNVNGPISITNIPVYVSNRFVYSPSLHRLMQLAANIYDATTNRNYGTGISFPTLFRPIFTKLDVGGRTDVYINGFAEVPQVNAWNYISSRPLIDVTSSNLLSQLQPDDRVIGVPLVIGAKKGLPNFNEFALDTTSLLIRKVALRRPDVNSIPNETNQLFVVGITNAFAFEAWNSYQTSFQRDVDIYVTNFMTVTVRFTNDLLQPNLNGVFGTNLTAGNQLNVPINTWTGVGKTPAQPVSTSFRIPLQTNLSVVPLSILRLPLSAPYLTNDLNIMNLFGENALVRFDRTKQYPMPEIQVIVKSRIVFAIVDKLTGGILDYVHLVSSEDDFNLTDAIMKNAPKKESKFWERPRFGAKGITDLYTGLNNQIYESQGTPVGPPAEWNSYPRTASKEKGIHNFRVFCGLSPYDPNYSSPNVRTILEMQAPYTPAGYIQKRVSWQANDPLVHYTAGDLAYLARGDDWQYYSYGQPIESLKNVRKLNDRYSPWGGNPSTSAKAATDFELGVKDPLIWSSDSWDFPTNQFLSVGWLGRVHRGTPWQTVYLKSEDVNPSQWTNWTGNASVRDAFLTRPVADRVLFDLFTAALNDNATRGQLNVNQDGLAAWSAGLGGLIALTNIGVEPLRRDASFVDAYILDPAGVSADPVNSAVNTIWAGVNRSRWNPVMPRGPLSKYRGAYYTNWVAGGTVTNIPYLSVGALLDAPELTVRSPVLNLNAAQKERGIDDATYERIPQMLLGLLRGNETPRFTIYAYGQALKPAERSVVTSGSQAGLVTNYQITAEFVTRTVVRLDVTYNTNDNRTISSVRPVIESYNVIGPE